MAQKKKTNNDGPSVTEGARAAFDALPESKDELTNDFPVVGIGASAGGLAAFERFFTALQPDTGMAFVVVQHLSPPHKSILPEILQRFTAMPVSQVTEGMAVRPDGVYVIPPGSDLALKKGHLALIQPEKARGYRLPIDFFFRSLAQDQGERAIGVVLSGTGSDGSLGLKTIKAEGGLTIAQEPETAEFEDMPKNAIATKEVDFILPPEKIGELILKYTHHKVLDGYRRGESDFQMPTAGLNKLFYLLRSKTGHDFSLYKQNSIQRRIERRMKICLVKNMDEYILRLEEQPEEIEALFQEMLINVTHFFRDPEAFQVLIERAIRPLIMLKHNSRVPIRVWVAGCSTGEEAYSIAIAMLEQLEALKTECPVQIFATDLDIEAVAAARRGFYSEGSLENVSPERLHRFFQQEEDGYRIRKKLRDMVVFSSQNLISDPPFSKIDLLSCRNLLIYLEHDLQKQLFHQFHYSLNPGGILFLGNSESISGNADLFAVIDRKHKIFQRKEVTTQRLVKTKTRLPSQRAASNEPESRSYRSQGGGLREWTAKVLLEFHAPACVITDLKHNILYTNGRTGKYLEPVTGETSNNLIRMAREGLKTELATAIHVAMTGNKTVRRESLQVKTNGDYQAIHLTVRLMDGPVDYGQLLMVVFEEAPPAAGNAQPVVPDTKPGNARSASNRQITRLEKALKEKDAYLHTIINELEDTNQDLKSTNEELQSINEEMQSSNEELETSKEELQSINEELSTINAELHNKNEELSGLNNDVYNLLASIEIGMIFVDMELKIRRFTPAINKIYNFLPADIGRPIDHFVSNLDHNHLAADIRKVLHDLIPRAREAQTKDGAWYLINIKPYRTLDNVIDGVVVTFVDISDQKQGDELRRLGTILRDSNDAVTVQDFRGGILAWNRGATQMYGWNEAEALTMNALEMIPEDKRAGIVELYQRVARGDPIQSFETQKITRDGRTIDIWVTVTALMNDAGQITSVATTERDITGRKPVSQIHFFENRALQALNRWNEVSLSLSETTPQSMAEAACRILVESGYRAAWMHRVMHENAATHPLAWVGVENDELETVMEAARETVMRALSSSQPVVARTVDDLQVSSGSILAIPIPSRHGPLGVLVIDAAEPEAFVEPEIEVLVGLCRRIAEVMGTEW